MPTPVKPVAIFGGTGHYGREVVARLLAKGQAVRVLTRCTADAKALLGDHPDYLEGDVRDPQAIAEMIRGAKAIVVALSATHLKTIRHKQAIEHDAVLHILEEAGRQGVKRLVYLSVYDIQPELLQKLKMEPFGAIPLAVERAISQTDLNWTVLGCAPSMELFFTFLRGKRMAVPGGGYRPIPTVYAPDVGEIAARAILRDDLGGCRFRMTGPKAISFPEFAHKVSELTGQPVRHLAIPLIALHFISGLARPFNPFLRFIYFGVKLFNHFPSDLAESVPECHNILLKTFSYSPRSVEEVIKERFKAQ